MTGGEIKGLRRTLDLTARKLGEALGVDQATVLAWEREELFPTRRHVEAMRALAAKATGGSTEEEEGTGKKGRDAGGREEEERGGADVERGAALHALADPAVWRLFRKILAHPELRARVDEMAAEYTDPADGG